MCLMQKRKYVEYINKIQLFGGRYFYLVITEKNNALTDLDFCVIDTFNKLGYKAKINTHTTSYIN